MSKCVFCGSELPPNNPVEHIILNAIGGKLKTNKLICGKCNHDLNEEIDTPLADQLNHLTNLLNVKRERGGSPEPLVGTSEKTGEEVKLISGGRPELMDPIYEVEIKDGKEIRNFTARSEEELRTYLKSLKKEGHDIDIEKEIQNAKRESVHPGQVNLNVQIGSKESFRSVCKTAVLYYLHSGGQVEHVKDAIEFVKGSTAEDRVGHFNPPQSVNDIGSGVVHRIYIKGDSKEKRLYSFVEYYGTNGFAVSLNENYQGPDYEASYCFDVLEKQVIQNPPSMPITTSEMHESVVKKISSKPGMEMKLAKVLETAMNKQREEFLAEKSKELIKKHFTDGTICTQEQVNAFCEDLKKLLFDLSRR